MRMPLPTFILAALPDLVIYLGPGVGLAIIGLVTFYIRRSRRSNDTKPL
jgi:hypothetical protein